MKRIGLTLLTVLVIGFSLSHCAKKDEAEQEEQYSSTDKWYSETKVKILKQSALQADCTVTTYNENRSYKTDHYYSKGHEFLSKGFNNGVLAVEIYYSQNEEFELRREICDNGNHAFEGIMHQGDFVGLSTWRNCNGNISEQGNRYKDKKIGVWKKYDRDGELTEVIDYKDAEKLELLPEIGN